MKWEVTMIVDGSLLNILTKDYVGVRWKGVSGKDLRMSVRCPDQYFTDRDPVTNGMQVSVPILQSPNPPNLRGEYLRPSVLLLCRNFLHSQTLPHTTEGVRVKSKGLFRSEELPPMVPSY